MRSRCELEIVSHALDLPLLRSKSAERDTRGVNKAKRGGERENRMLLRSRQVIGCERQGRGRGEAFRRIGVALDHFVMD